MLPLSHGQETGAFGRSLTKYLQDTQRYTGFCVYYDHGDKSMDPNVSAIHGFVGHKLSNRTRLVEADVMIVGPNQSVRLLIEIEEKLCSPKKLLGIIMAHLMCDRYAVKPSGTRYCFRVDAETKLLIAGYASAQGSGLPKIQTVIRPAVWRLQGRPGGIRPTQNRAALHRLFVSHSRGFVEKGV